MKISEGKYEIFTTKEDAIDKFRQLQGICREKISNKLQIEFNCSKKGKITIEYPRTTGRAKLNSTNLYGEIIEQDGKTYLTYYTSFSRAIAAANLIYDIICIIMAIICVVIAVKTRTITNSLIILLICIILTIIQMFGVTREKKNSLTDSLILVKELENRVDAVNDWDK